MRGVVRALWGDRGSLQTFACIAVALRKTLYERAEILSAFYASFSPMSLASVSAGVLYGSFTLPGLRAAVLLMYRRCGLGQEEMPSKVLFNLPEAALWKLLQCILTRSGRPIVFPSGKNPRLSLYTGCPT